MVSASVEKEMALVAGTVKVEVHVLTYENLAKPSSAAFRITSTGTAMLSTSCPLPLASATSRLCKTSPITCPPTEERRLPDRAVLAAPGSPATKTHFSDEIFALIPALDFKKYVVLRVAGRSRRRLNVLGVSRTVSGVGLMTRVKVHWLNCPSRSVIFT